MFAKAEAMIVRAEPVIGRAEAMIERAEPVMGSAGESTPKQ